jgi:hypothetical protein
MATTVLNIGPFILGTSETNILNVPVGHDYNVNVVRFGNTDTVDRTITIYRYTPPSTISTAGSIVLNTFTLPPHTMYEYGPDIVSGGRILSAVSDVANKVTVHVSGWDHS